MREKCQEKVYNITSGAVKKLRNRIVCFFLALLKRAAALDAELSKERGLTDDLMERDTLRWILLAGQIHLEVLRRLEQEIQR